MTEWDLTPVLAKFLDPQLVIGLLEFLDNKGIYDSSDILKYKIDILVKNNLLEYLKHVYERNDIEVSEELAAKCEKIAEERGKLAGEVSEILESLGDLDEQQQLQVQLQSKQLYSLEKVNQLYEFARMTYNSAVYDQSLLFLNSYQILITPQGKNYVNALWGILACSILSQDWKQALDHFNFLKGYIDNSNFTPSQALQQRTWLIHWGLFIFFNIESGRDLLVEVFFDSKQQGNKQMNNPYLNVIHTTCPHILRYLTAAVITHRQRRNYMKELVRFIQQEQYNYRDPITEFVECLYVNFDFDGAQKKLRDCEFVLRIDFFLTACIEDFIQNARLFIFEIFCQIHELYVSNDF
ncbi:Eukaryotic translation initiation factor 3 subunit E, partial [Blomia tropicalis]